MYSKSCSEKENAIFNGIETLIKNGINPYSIKVSDIAKASNVGKGTIYDYFKTKEEAITKALLYSINNEMIKACDRVHKKESFQQKFYEILRIIIESVENNLSPFNILISSGGVQEFYQYLMDDQYDLSNVVLTMDNIIEYLLSVGLDEGVINPKENHIYQIMAIRCSIAGFSGYMQNTNWHPEISIEEAMDTSYKVLIKALR